MPTQGIASSWIWLEDYGGFASEYAFPQMETAARKALSLNSSSPEALMAMGLYYYAQLDDAVMGKTLFEYALKENPSLVEIYTHYADVLLAMNQQQESLHYRLEALKVDPLSSFYRARYIKALSAENRTEEAQQQLDIIFADDPDDTYGLEELGNLYRYQGNIPKSIDAYTKVHNLRPGDPFSASQMAKSLEMLGLSELSNYWARQARLRSENNRWELNSRFVIAAIRADWQAMLTVADIKAISDVDVGDSWRGFALLNLEQYDEARSAFERSLKTINMQLSKKFKTENLYALFGMVLLDDIQNRTNTY
jgi:tetratricopeptide (TPR) repeat protein